MVVSEQFKDYSRFIVQIKCNVGCHNPKHAFTKVLTIGWAIRSDWRDCLAQINTVHSSWFKPHKTIYWAQNLGHHPNVLGYMKNKKKISDTCNLGYPCSRKSSLILGKQCVGNLKSEHLASWASTFVAVLCLKRPFQPRPTGLFVMSEVFSSPGARRTGKRARELVSR